MNLEIHEPELERRVREGLQGGRFRNLDWSKCPSVESVPAKLSGAWVFRDTRLPVAAVFGNLEDGATVDEIADWFRISRDQVVAVLAFAARSVAGTAAPARDADPV
jgi:uncharacterized protein (DUF433 family)